MCVHVIIASWNIPYVFCSRLVPELCLSHHPSIPDLRLSVYPNTLLKWNTMRLYIGLILMNLILQHWQLLSIVEPLNLCTIKVHYHVPENSEHLPLKWFCIKTSHHHLGRARLYMHIFVIYTVSNKKYPILMFRLWQLLEYWPLLSNFVLLWLYWYTKLSDTVNPRDSRKYRINNIWGIMWSIPTSSASIKLFVFNFFCGWRIYRDFSEGYNTSYMTPRVVLDRKCCTHSLFYAPSTITSKCD